MTHVVLQISANMLLSHSLLSRLVGMIFTFARAALSGLILLPARRKTQTHSELFTIILSCDMIAAA